jgi:hypothetical protein
MVACAVAPTEKSNAQNSHSALGADSDDPPSSDPDLANLIQNGFSSMWYVGTCVSEKDGAPTLTGDPLPVGGGRHLACQTRRSPTRGTAIFSNDTKPAKEWCLLGESLSFKTDGHPKLTISVTSTPADKPWTVIGTHDGDEISISTGQSFGGKTWPLFINVAYKTLEIRRLPPGTRNCEEVFGL